MPRVPSADREVRTAPNATPFQSGRGATPDAFGAREAMATIRQSQGVVQLGEDLGNISLAIQKAENDRAAKEMDIEFSQRVRGLMFGTDENPLGYMHRQGTDAVDRAPDVISEMENIRAEVLAQAPNDRVSKDWDLSSKAELEVQNEAVGRHAGAERVRSISNANEAWIQNREAAGLADALDPLSRERALSEIRIGLEDQQAILGWGDEEFTARLNSRQGEFHKGVVSRILTGEDPLMAPRLAREYFEENKDRISGEFHSDIEKAIRLKANNGKASITRETNEAIKIIEQDRDYANMADLSNSIDALGSDGTELRLALDRAIQDRPIMSDFNQLPISARETIVEEGRIDTRRNADQDRIYKKQVQALKDAKKAIADGDGILLAVNNKLLPSLEPLNNADAQSWAARAMQADEASRELGVSVSPLTDAETDGLIATLEGGTLDEQASILDAMVEGGGIEMTDRLAQDIVEDHPGAAWAFGIVGEDPNVARFILQGENRMAQNENLIPSSEDQNAAKEAVFGELFDEHSDGDTLASAHAATLAYLAATSDPAADIRGNFNEDDYREAAEKVTGGILRNNQGRPIFAPVRGMAQNQFDSVQRSVGSDVLSGDFSSGEPVFEDGSPVPASVLDEGAELITTGPGQYMVRIPGQGFIHNLEDDEIFELNLGEAVKSGTIEVRTDPLTDEDRSQLEALGLVAPAPLAEALTRTQNAPEAPAATPEPRLVAPSTPEIEAAEQTAIEREQEAAPSGFPRPRPRPVRPTRSIEDSLVNVLIREEGFGSTPYEDLVEEGLMIVGYGHAVVEGETFDVPLTQADARELLIKDIKKHTAEAKKLPFWSKLDNPARQAAISHMVFVLGLGRTLEFKRMGAAIARQDWDTAAAEMIDSEWGLSQAPGRVSRIAEQLRTGQF